MTGASRADPWWGDRAMEIRPERAVDAPTIRAVIAAAFEGAPYSDGTEPAIVDALRRSGALQVSLVAVLDGEVVGHVAFSPITIEDGSTGWFGLGPLSVRPDRQGTGIGQALVRDGLDRLSRMGAAGCVVLGSPTYYSRFGFEADPSLRYPAAAAEYFQRLMFRPGSPRGEAAFHPGFFPGGDQPA